MGHLGWLFWGWDVLGMFWPFPFVCLIIFGQCVGMLKRCGGGKEANENEKVVVVLRFVVVVVVVVFMASGACGQLHYAEKAGRLDIS
jgi:hypothetical protein